jgi:hypothetical protein
MSDLQLEVANTEVKQTTLIGAPGDLGTTQIKDFTGAHVLECIPHSSLVNSSVPTNNFGGIFGRGVGTGIGVRGMSTSGAGVQGETNTGPGVRGQGNPGVAGNCQVRRTRALPVPGDLAGVHGESADGPGVFGNGHIGGQFRGKSAQLALVPGSGIGKPTTGHHDAGEIYMDAAGSLFICVGPSTPGIWVKVTVTPA